MSSLARISPTEAHAKMTSEGYTYVDVRTPEEFAEGRPAGSINIPLGDDFVRAVEAKFAKDARIIVGCKAGGRSLRAATALVAAGFTSVLDQRAGSTPRAAPSAKSASPAGHAQAFRRTSDSAKSGGRSESGQHGACGLRRQHGACGLRRQHGACRLRRQHGACRLRRQHGACGLRRQHGACGLRLRAQCRGG